MKMNVRANTAVVTGKVTVNQGTSVVNGEKLNVNSEYQRGEIFRGPCQIQFRPRPEPGGRRQTRKLIRNFPFPRGSNMVAACKFSKH